VIRRWRRRAGHDLVVEFVLSGFITERSYKDRRPDWEPEPATTLEDAIAQGSEWVQSYGPSSQVEVIRVEGEVGHVVRVVTYAGVETIER
jgi:hypothetical protein